MLKSGARIAVIAPAGRFDADRLTRGMDAVSSWGYALVPGANLHCAHRFNAGTDAQRAADLRWALTDPDIDAVWFARGGYGTGRLLADVPWGQLDQRPVIGFSDATALFSAFVAQGQGVAIHAPVLHSLVDVSDQASLDSVRALLAGGTAPGLPGHQIGGPAAVAHGPVVGGNLCVLASLSGTPWALSGKDRIVLLEDVGEAPYRVDRMLGQLVDGGSLAGVCGIGLGRFVGCDAPEGVDWSLQDVIRDRLAVLNVPIVAGLPVGHGAENVAWQVGRTATLTETGIAWTNVDPS